MRSIALSLCLAACTHTGGSNSSVAVEDMRKELRFELEQMKATLARIEKKQSDLEAKLARPAGAAPAREEPDENRVIPYAVGDSPVRGAPDAWVTIIEVSDFQCPFCSRVQQTLRDVETRYGNDVRLVYKHNPLPFHDRAMPAAIASMCAHEQGKFWPLHDALFANQRALDDEGLATYAKQVSGLNFAKWQSCYSSGRPKARIEAEMQVANDFGARGTPAFFVNGRSLVGAQPFDRFAALIDEELAKAKASGIPRRDYYEKAVVAGP
jgi:protein-disulfide isomerase